MTQITPKRNYLLIRRAPAENRSPGGLYIPDAHRAKAGRGTVVAAGPGRHTETGVLVAPECKPGQVVLFRADLGQDVDVEGETFVLIDDDAVMVVIEEGA